MNGYTVVSLFSGAGGLDLGFLQTGKFEILLANDFNTQACETYRKNIGTHIVQGDIRELVDVPKADILIGGPPCQGFSTANPARSINDPRNLLFQEYSRILEQVSPKIFLMENVPGMLSLDGGKALKSIISEFEQVGYTIQYKVLNSKDFGIPQNRKRLIIIGSKILGYAFPAPLPKIPTLREVLTVPVTGIQNNSYSILSMLNKERIKHIPPGGSMKDCPVHLRNNSDIKRAMQRLHMDRISPTICHSNCDHYYHPIEDRRVTIREMARIQGYPDNHVFYGSKAEQSRQVANSVPVPFAFHLAESVVEYLNNL